jgi:hypothetical protein
LISIPNNLRAIRNFTTEWYIEYKDASQKIIDSFHRPGGNAIGHFTMMVNDKQSKGNLDFLISKNSHT